MWGSVLFYIFSSHSAFFLHDNLAQFELNHHDSSYGVFPYFPYFPHPQQTDNSMPAGAMSFFFTTGNSAEHTSGPQ